MFRFHFSLDISRLEDGLVALAATVYFSGFIAAIEIALSKLNY
jgi:hypothetical protein